MRINYLLVLLGLAEAIFGEADSSKACPRACGFKYEPVCASNGKTYENTCLFEKFNCENRFVFKIVGRKPCPELTVDRGCFKVCSYNYSPVCASSGKTYSNKCSFEVDNCLSGYQWTLTKEEHCKECPSDASIGTCLVNPCDESTCPAYPLAECQPSHCGKCEAEFFVGAQKVECIPQSTKKELPSVSRVKDMFPELNFDGCSADCEGAYRPVCGSDRRTHLSDCHMRKAACTTNSLVFKMHNGECGQCKLVCSGEYNPQCGTDGVTYANKCLMELKTCETSGRLFLAYAGTCEEPECPTLCKAHYRPVCGKDGKTYGNWCELQVASCKSKGAVKFSYEGECRQCLPVCTAEYDPFCGTDGKTYGNRCMMNYGICTTGGRVQVKYQGECGKPRCLENCTRAVDPVCGTDNHTYRNLCLLSQATCSSKGDTFLAYFGLCASRCQSYKACPSMVKPVCGTDGETYANSCLLRGATCRSGGAITYAYPGVCKKCPADHARVVCTTDPCNTAVCPQHPRASCRTNACGSCRAEFFYGDEKVDCGSECSQICSKEYFPFCGTDGKTYSNKCMLNVARCLHRSLQLAYQGPCKSAFL